MPSGRTPEVTTRPITESSIPMTDVRIQHLRTGPDTVSVLMSATNPTWDVEIDEHPDTQTVVFEETLDWNNWAPVKGQRLKGPGPRLGTIITNAVAGGPAHFRGKCSPGVIAFRVRCARWDNAPIDMRITTQYDDAAPETVNVRIVGPEGFIFVIEEEKSLEDLLSEL